MQGKYLQRRWSSSKVLFAANWPVLLVSAQATKSERFARVSKILRMLGNRSPPSAFELSRGCDGRSHALASITLYECAKPMRLLYKLTYDSHSCSAGTHAKSYLPVESRSRFSSRTFTRGSPRKPNWRGAVCFPISVRTCSRLRPGRALATRAAW